MIVTNYVIVTVPVNPINFFSTPGNLHKKTASDFKTGTIQ